MDSRSIRMPNPNLDTVDGLAEALYEGHPCLSNLAEKLARLHGQAEALPFYGMTGKYVRKFWRSIAESLILHSRQWLPNDGSLAVLVPKEIERLEALPEPEIGE